MSARSGKSGSNSRSGSPSGGGGGAGYGPPPMPAISSYGSVYDGPGNIPLMGPGPPPPRPPAVGPPPPPMIGVEGAPAGPAPYAGLDKQASRKVLNMPPYSSLNNKREAPAYEELINFPRAKDKDEMRCVMCGLPPSEQCVIPRQNKDVCKECDKSTWLHIASDVYFKWCKGCKKFLKLGSFSQKLDAAKCDKCRERGRQSYLQKKGKDADEGALLGLPHRHHHHAGPPHMGPPHLFPPPPGVGFPPHHMPPPPHMAGRGPPPGPFIGLPPPPPGLIPPPHGSGRGGRGRGSYRELEGEDLIGEGSSGEEEHGGHHPHAHLPPPPPPHIMGPPGHHGHGGHPGLLPVPPPPSISAALGGEHGGASGGSSVAGSEAEREELSAGGQASRTEEGEEGTEEGEDMLSKLKRGGTPVPMGQEAGAMAQPGTPTGASTQAAPGGSPFPTTPGGTVVGGAGATTLSSLIGATEASGNNLMELARIHQQIVDLEAQAEQVSALSAQLEAERRRNRHLQGHVEQLNEELEKARREADALKQQLEEWYAREAALRAAEGLGPVLFGGEEGKGDKRNRSDSVAGAAALLGGFKKQKVSASGGAGGEGLSVATEGAGAGGAEGELEAPQTAEQPGSAPAGEGGKGEAFGVGYETPRANAIKGAPIAL